MTDIVAPPQAVPEGGLGLEWPRFCYTGEWVHLYAAILSMILIGVIYEHYVLH